MTHTKLGLNPWGGIKKRSNDMSHCKDGAGACNWQLQNDDHNHKMHGAEYHQEESQKPKADMKGDWETSVSENLQIKKCNRLMGRQSMATNEERQSQTTPSSSKAPKRSPNLEPITWDVDVVTLLTPRRPPIIKYSDKICSHVTTCYNSLMEKWLKAEGPHLGTIAHTVACCQRTGVMTNTQGI